MGCTLTDVLTRNRYWTGTAPALLASSSAPAAASSGRRATRQADHAYGHGWLSSWTVVVTPEVLPPPDVMCSIVHAGDGTLVTTTTDGSSAATHFVDGKRPVPWQWPKGTGVDADGRNVLVVSTAEGLSLGLKKKVQAAGLKQIHSAETVLSGAWKQMLELNKNVIFSFR